MQILMYALYSFTIQMVVMVGNVSHLSVYFSHMTLKNNISHQKKGRYFWQKIFFNLGIKILSHLQVPSTTEYAFLNKEKIL
jgi:hypothetical protein